MRVIRFERPEDFYRQAEGFLIEHEACHSLTLGIVGQLMKTPALYRDEPYLATLEHKGRVEIVRCLSGRSWVGGSRTRLAVIREEEEGARKHVYEELEEYIETCGERYLSNLRTMLTYLVEGVRGQGESQVYKTLKRAYPEEQRGLERILRDALLAAEDRREQLLIPEGYHLDRSDPDVLILKRGDGSVVANFSSRGVSQRGLLTAIREDMGRRSTDE